jgi:hypothetical protein
MPKVSEFYGIRIYFYFEDHPPPHFHAFYGEHEAQVSIESLEILEGFLPSRAYALVVEWALEHRAELRRAWEQAARPGPIDPIVPLR